MKKITFVLIVVLFSTLLSSAQVRYGITAGGQLASQKSTFSRLTVKTQNQVGYMGGLIADAPLTEKFSIRPQLLYSVKGAKFDFSSLTEGLFDGPESAIIFNYHYIEVPVQLAYSLEAGPGSVVLGGGPYIAYALSAKASTTESGQKLTEKIEFGKEEGEAKRLDYGLRLSVGYELPSGLMVSGYYSPGLANIMNGTYVTTKNSAFGLSIGILFGER